MPRLLNLTKTRLFMVYLYLFCLAAGLLFTLVTAIAGHLFGGGDHGHLEGSGGHAEAGADLSDAPGVSAFSPTIMSIFVTAFGAFGVILSQFSATKSVWLSVPLAMLGAFATGSTVLVFLRMVFRKTQGSSESKVATLAGQSATVITPIPENGVGEIAYVQAGTRYTAPARSEDHGPVGNGQTVKITRVVAGQFYVRSI